MNTSVLLGISTGNLIFLAFRIPHINAKKSQLPVDLLYVRVW